MTIDPAKNVSENIKVLTNDNSQVLKEYRILLRMLGLNCTEDLACAIFHCTVRFNRVSEMGIKEVTYILHACKSHFKKETE